MTQSQETARRNPGPWVDIDLNALCANYALLRDAAPKAETAAVVKCDAYGLGAETVARTLAEREGCGVFFVAYPQEGATLRAALKSIKPAPTIYVFNGPLPGTLPLFETAGLTPILNSLDQAQAWAERQPGAPAALHADTGMNRLGAAPEDLETVSLLNGLNITLIMSHLACASEPLDPKNERQRAMFETAAAAFPNARRSLAASGGALMGEAYHYDLIRPGIALYGASPFEEDEPRLKPVAALKAPIIQVRRAAAGESVGYGATQALEKPSLLATAALGYGDGFPRSGSGGENEGALAFVNGGRAPVIGRVSMDLIVLDVTNLPHNTGPGDVAEFFGPNLSIHETAAACKTISYELLTGLGGRVDRRYL